MPPIPGSTIIRENNISKREFARRVGITENYLYILTGNSRADVKSSMKLSASLVKLIALEFGYNEEWILHGTGDMKRENEKDKNAVLKD